MAGAGLSVARGAVGRDPIAPLAKAADRLAELRGLATKAGQMVSVWTATLSPKDRARAAPVLERLRARTMSSDPMAVRALVERELGARIEERFARFEETPFASASLGEVHRARLHEAEGGLEVAVKVQHPGIDAALRADLDNVGQLGTLAALLALSGGDALVAEVRARMLEELDYEAEARWQRRFSELFVGDDAISIPRVIAHASASRVLTTELVRGRGIHEAAARPDARASPDHPALPPHVVDRARPPLRRSARGELDFQRRSACDGLGLRQRGALRRVGPCGLRRGTRGSAASRRRRGGAGRRSRARRTPRGRSSARAIRSRDRASARAPRS
jgi:hypothetical protein